MPSSGYFMILQKMKIKITSTLPKGIHTTVIPILSGTIKAPSWLTKNNMTSLEPGLHHIVENGVNKKYFLVNISSTKTSDTWLKLALDQVSLLSQGVVIDLSNEELFSELRPAIQGFFLANYQLDKYTGAKKNTRYQNQRKAIHFLVSKEHITRAKQVLREEEVLCRQQMEVMDLVNGPGNIVNAPYFNKWVRKMSRECGFKVKVLNKKKITEIGLDGLLAVNRGSEWDPSFIIAEYHGNKDAKARTLGLVGKGVTFDTGGLSIKTGDTVHYMKSDMGGAAAVLGTISAVAALKWPVNIIAITPITDNCVDAKAIKPGDIINSYSGKTIEVINTDAEGRLILADALSYLISNYEVDHIIDLATLTGSSVRTFGPVCAALFSNDEELEEQLFLSGLETHEKVWSLPLWKEYDDEMKSDVADIKNLSTRPMAGAITAAKFLQYFVQDHPSWAHLDIAGVAFGETKFSKGKAATGYGVHLLCHFIKENLLN